LGRVLEHYYKKIRIPGESRDPPFHSSSLAKWIPAFAGNADFQLATPSLTARDFGMIQGRRHLGLCRVRIMPPLTDIR